MINWFQHIFWGILLTLLFASCGGAQKVAGTDPLEMLARGQYARARALVKSNGPSNPTDCAVVAISYLAESPNKISLDKAVQTLNKGQNQIATATAANEMLALAKTLPPISNNEFSLLLIEAALGAAGYGTYAQSRSKPEPGSKIAVLLAVSSLERLNIHMSINHKQASQDRILEIWNGCYSLLGGSLSIKNNYQAWCLYTSIAGIAIVFAATSPNAELSRVLLQSAVLTIEQNQEISHAARCDMSSPFDKLKPVLLRHRDLLGRLERAVSGATGCTLGTYAPRPEE